MHVVGVSYGCYRCFYLNVAKVYRGMLHVLQWTHTYVASVCLKCFSYSRRMLQLFYLMLQSRSGCSMCYDGFVCMLQIYVLNVLFIFKHMLQLFFSGCCKI
jgi:hypothetical protein